MAAAIYPPITSLTSSSSTSSIGSNGSNISTNSNTSSSNSSMIISPPPSPLTTAISPSPSRSSSSSPSPLLPSHVIIRRSNERGHVNHGWLNSYHTFSFASYFDPKFSGFHSLRVINEDRVSPSRGFPAHGHSDAEIFSYVVRGSLAHKDSMGNHEILGRGAVQFTSAGTGVRHSEFNASQREMVHFVQIWVTPIARSLKPNYQTVEYDEKERVNRLALLVAPCGTDTKVHGKHAVISQDIKAYACVLQVDHTVTYTIPCGRVGYVHVVQDSLSMTAESNKTGLLVNGVILSGGDGGYLTPLVTGDASTLTFTSTGNGAEFLLFDIAPLRKPSIEPRH